MLLRLSLAAVVLSVVSLQAQVCRLLVAGLNRNRRVTGPVSTECRVPLPPSVHSAPFGNWGVTSNFGVKRDSHQFDGWCHDSQVCDNSGNCRTDCRDGWYEWNSCTDQPAYRAPNCTLYNANDCTQQVSVVGINIHGTKTEDIPAGCPADTNSDGVPDQGGCSEIRNYTSTSNFMSLYELDPATGDELIQTVYYPDAMVGLVCSVWGCPPAGSNWVNPSFYDSPSSPAKVTAELAVVVNSAVFIDTNRRCTALQAPVETVSAASYSGSIVAAESIVSGFGQALSIGTASATTVPLPTQLSGTSISVTDSGGTTRAAPLFFVSPGQANYQIPAGTAVGTATITATRSDGIRSVGTVEVRSVAPGLFAANADGSGVAAAVAQRYDAAGNAANVPVFTCSGDPVRCVAVPMDLGAQSDRLILLLFATGIRGHGGLSTVNVTIGGQRAEVLYAGPQGQFVGLDQLNVVVPRNLRGRGNVNVVVRTGGSASNTVLISVL
ncbi:MAG: hypothetical protein ACRD7E_28980 [Bryobacteraceae bacterium]